MSKKPSTTKNKTSAIKDVTPENKKLSKEQKKKNVEYGYSVNLTSDKQEKEAHSEKTKLNEDNLSQSLKDLKQNPQALDALKKALQKVETTPLTKKQALVQIAKKITISNIQKVLKAGLKNVDLFMNYVIKKNGPGRNDVLQQARPPIVFGIWVAFFTFIVAGVWSGFAPLDSSSHATGFVIPSSKKQIIQHKEGGIIEKIYVKEGEKVDGAAPLLKLSDVVLKSQIKALKSQKESTDKQLTLVKEQLEEMHKLFEEGFVPKDKLINLQSREAELIGHVSELESRLINAEESFNRLLISAPISGTVNQIQSHTIGAVISPGGTLMTIVPDDDNLIIEAYVKPDDIDSVYIGLKAKIRISAFKHRSVAPMEGIVTHISSDVVEPLQQHQSQEAMILQQGLQYRVKIEVDQDQLTKISKYRNYELHPGMMADVMIVTGERTVLQYLMDPITSTFWHSFIEK
jgi:multidrug efflux pump subunit AcrA (membrane-fusion protein)